MKEHTLAEKILLAILKEEDRVGHPLNAPTIVVEAWRWNKSSLGLEGWVDIHPDSNKILAYLMGVSGIVKRGWLNKVGVKTYSVTAAGRKKVGELNGEAPPVVERKTESPFSVNQEFWLYRLFNSVAIQFWKQGNKKDINFSLATEFWCGLGDREDVKIAVDMVDVFLKAVLGWVPLNTEVVWRDGRVFTHEEAQTLYDLHVYLQDHFSCHLKLLEGKNGVATHV